MIRTDRLWQERTTATSAGDSRRGSIRQPSSMTKFRTDTCGRRDWCAISLLTSASAPAARRSFVRFPDELRAESRLHRRNHFRLERQPLQSSGPRLLAAPPSHLFVEPPSRDPAPPRSAAASAGVFGPSAAFDCGNHKIHAITH